MIGRVVPTTEGQREKWVKDVADSLNQAEKGYPYIRSDTAPALDSVEAGYTYFDTVLGKVRTFDGAAFNNHW
jgi:hypothetical protein